MKAMDGDEFDPDRSQRRRAKKRRRASRNNWESIRWRPSPLPSIPNIAFWPTALIVAIGPIVGVFHVIGDGASWKKALISTVVFGVAGILFFVMSLKSGRCDSCRAYWTVRPTGNSEERTEWFFSSTYDQYECDRCGNQMWRKSHDAGGG